MKYAIYINEARFEADESTIGKVISAIEAAGFVYDETTEGFVEPDFYDPTEEQIASCA